MPLPKSVGGYRFIDKDPAIELFQFALREFMRSTKSDVHEAIAQIAEESGVSKQTLRKWEFGSTKKPQRLTLRFAMEACGFTEQYVNEEGVVYRVNYRQGAKHAFTNTGGEYRPRLRVVK